MLEFYVYHPTILRGTDPFPDISFIPPLIKRKLTTLERVGLYLSKQTTENLDQTSIHCTFASRYGEWQEAVKLFNKFKEEHELSPAGFSTAVHNAMPGYYSMLFKNSQSYTSISAKEKTLESGLLEALLTQKNSLFIYAEENKPSAYENILENVQTHGLAVLFTEQKTDFKVQINFNYCSHSPLLFSECIDFFEGKTSKITTSHFTMERL